MLRRRSIRTKLVYALVVMSLIFAVLAGGSLWGVSRYSRLADSVYQQASEIPTANQLSRNAESIRRSYARIRKLRDHIGMIEVSVLADTDADMEIASIGHNLFDMSIALERYAKVVDESEAGERLLVAKSRQQDSLAAIQATKDKVDSLWGTPQIISVEGNAEFSGLLTQLVRETNAHLDLIHSEMAGFSEDVRGQYAYWFWLTIFCIVLAVLLVALLWFSFISLIAKPFRTLLDGSRLVAAGQYGHRIDLGTADELSELAQAMNCMSTRFRDVYNELQVTNENLDLEVKQRTREVIRSEQLASVGHLAAGVSHEINNPLASIAWSAESLESDLEDLMVAGCPMQIDDDFAKTLQTNLQRIQEQAYRCKDITQNLLEFSRMGDATRATIDVCEVVNKVIELVGQVGTYRCKTLRVHADKDVYAHANEHEIRQVVLNLVTNAMESVDSDGAVDVYVRNQDGQAYVGVKDNGCGMPQEVLDHLFEPFFTRRRDGTGTGLGLSITYRIVDQHNGTLTASSEGEGKGSCMELMLPASPVVDESIEPTRELNGREYDARQAA